MSRREDTPPSSLDTLGAIASFLQDQGLQVKTENDLQEMVKAHISAFAGVYI